MRMTIREMRPGWYESEVYGLCQPSDARATASSLLQDGAYTDSSWYDARADEGRTFWDFHCSTMGPDIAYATEALPPELRVGVGGQLRRHGEAVFVKAGDIGRWRPARGHSEGVSQ